MSPMRAARIVRAVLGVVAVAAVMLVANLAYAQTAMAPYVVTGQQPSGAPTYSLVGNGAGGSVPLPVSISGGAPSGPAGGDLAGTYPNPSVVSVGDVTTGVLAAANGGIGSGSLTDHGLVIAHAGAAFTTTTPGNNCVFQQVSSTGNPSCATSIGLNSVTSSIAVTINGTLNVGTGNPVISATAPTIASGFGTGASVSGVSTAGFQITIGTGGTASTGTLTMPTSSNRWGCMANDVTTTSASVFMTKQTGVPTNAAVTLTNFSSSAAATAWTAGDLIEVVCAGE